MSGWGGGGGGYKRIRNFKKKLINQNQPLSPQYFSSETREDVGTGL